MRGRAPLVIHYAYDMSRAIKFYGQVFDIRPEFESPGWTSFDCGSIQLALHILDHDHNDETVLPNAGLNFLVDDIEEMQRYIEAAGGELVELREPDGFVPVCVASFKDCEGNGFELRQEP